MRTIKTEQHICQFCNKDFTRTPYRVMINHSNKCGYHNVACSIWSFYDAEEYEKIDVFYDFIGLKDSVSYEEVMDIYNCVFKMIKNGHIDINEVENTKDFTEIIQFMIDNKNSIVFKFNENINNQIDEIRNKADREIKSLEKHLV